MFFMRVDIIEDDDCSHGEVLLEPQREKTCGGFVLAEEVLEDGSEHQPETEFEFAMTGLHPLLDDALETFDVLELLYQFCVLLLVDVFSKNIL